MWQTFMELFLIYLALQYWHGVVVDQHVSGDKPTTMVSYKPQGLTPDYLF